MSPLRLNGSTSGFTTLDAPAVAGSNTLVLPTGNGTADQALVTNGTGTLSFADRGRMTLATAQNSTSGTSIDFTSIPSWVKRITVMFSGVSTNGTANPMIQIGAGSVSTSGYLSSSTYTSGAAGATATSTAGYLLNNSNNASVFITGNVILNLLNSSTGLWVCSGSLAFDTITYTIQTAGSKTLSGTLDRVRITTTNGTDTFDAGSINILYEG